MMTALWLCKSFKRYATHQQCAPSHRTNNGCAICGTVNWRLIGRRLKRKTKSSQTVKWKRYVNAGKAPDGAPYWGSTPTACGLPRQGVAHPEPRFFPSGWKIGFWHTRLRATDILTAGQKCKIQSSTLKSQKTLAYKDVRMIITLTESEQMIVNYVAKCRNEANIANGSHKRGAASTMTSFEIDQQGFGGELAFCKAMNVFPDFTVFCRSAAKGEDDGDCTVQGLRIDVKTSKKATSALWVKEGKKGCADAFALVTGTFPTFTVVGIASHEMVFVDGKKIDDQFVVDQAKLIHPDVFFSPVFF